MPLKEFVCTEKTMLIWLCCDGFAKCCLSASSSVVSTAPEVHVGFFAGFFDVDVIQQQRRITELHLRMTDFCRSHFKYVSSALYVHSPHGLLCESS